LRSETLVGTFILTIESFSEKIRDLSRPNQRKSEPNKENV
jgi:hypothetical protein